MDDLFENDVEYELLSLVLDNPLEQHDPKTHPQMTSTEVPLALFDDDQELARCSCLEPPTPEAAYEDAYVVFSGQVTNISLDERGYYFEVAFQTIDIWKGEILAEIIVLTETSSSECGYDFQINNEYLVYGYNYGNDIYTNICTRTNLLENANEDLDYLNQLPTCAEGYVEIDDICFYGADIAVLQTFIDNSYASGIDLGCDDDSSAYCGSPNPQMDSPTDAWFWNIM